MKTNWFELAKEICIPVDHKVEVCGTCGEEYKDNGMADCDECIRQQDAVQPDPRGELMDARRDAAYERRNRE